MDLNEIKKLVKIVENSEVTELFIREGELKIKISKNSKQQNIIPQYIQAEQPVVQNLPEVVEETKSEPELKSNDEDFHVVNSPIVGTFYRAPAPDADPYIQVGDIVSSGSVLCIIEAMKLMNEIESDVDGKIVEILVENGKPVEFNQPLFKIKKS
ncbi:MAG: acetyl-CoA carboxylase, biotin carboxyl carrier protein [Ignavibacteriae bacterium]|nr:MAG: acetyl-CoA carboxylase, biotin carboxyl carrier protein [Ignavibacteriota bacterium]